MPPKKKNVNAVVKEKTISLENAKSTPRRSSRYSSNNDQDKQEVSKNCDGSRDNHEKAGDSENMKSDGRMKRKADALVKSEKAVKSPKVFSTVKNEDTTFSPRRSSRGVVPNRQFKDMEVDFTPGRKQVAKLEENNETTNQTTPMVQNNQNLDTRRVHTKSKRSTSGRTTALANDNDELSVTSTASTEEDISKNNQNEISLQPKHDLDTNNETQPFQDNKIESVPSIKIIKFDQDNNMQITDFDSKENQEESDTPDFSIIREEDLEKITSELLELAQNAEQEHNELQQIMFKDSAQNDKNLTETTDFTITPMKIIEIHPESENDSNMTKNNSGDDNPSINSVSNQADSVKDENNYAANRNQNTVMKEDDIDTGIKCRSDKQGPECRSDNHVPECRSDNLGSECRSDNHGPDLNVISKKIDGVVETIVVENIMLKKASQKINEQVKGSNETDNDTNKEKNDSSSKKEKVDSGGNDNAVFSREDVIPISFEDSEIQIAVRNALMQLTEKSAENEENSDTEKPTEKEANTEKVKPENVSSSGTQTAAEGNVIKLPAINVKSKNGPLKTFTVDVRDGLQIDESGKKGKSGTSSKQEFIVVHVPDGQVVKRSTVRINKPEDCIPFSIDQDGVYHCGLCNYTNDKRVNLYKHRKKHVDDKPHCCPYCKYRAATSSNLKRHISIHQDVRNFRCHLCNTTFRQKIHLERHIRYRHEEKKVKCPLCDYVCANENPDLKVHMKRRHLPQDGEDGSISAFKCTECDLVTVNKKDFKQHMKFHRAGPELKLFCEYCSFVTDCESRLRRHSYIHSREKPFKCGMCDYRASQKEHVVRHMRSQHGIEIERKTRRNDDDEESLDGSIDSREDSSETKESSENKSDKFDYSSQEKIFACNHCSMKFAKLINLYKHLHAQHKEILPEQTDSEFLCVVCDFKTTTKKNLLVHMRKHNQIDQIPPSHVYSCVLCNYINPKRRNLFQHMKKKHGIEIVMKDDGSTSCFVTDGSVIASKCDETVQNILTIGDVVTTETEEQELQIVTDDLEKDGIQVQNVISFDDIAYAVSHPQPHNRNLIVVEPNSALVQEHEAAEAIEGLQALAEQPGIITCPEIISEITPQLISVAEEDEGKKPKTETEVITIETENVQNEAEEKTETEDGIQISSDEVMQLSAGDYVEINGEMYKVEISEATGLSNTEIVTST